MFVRFNQEAIIRSLRDWHGERVHFAEEWNKMRLKDLKPKVLSQRMVMVLPPQEGLWGSQSSMNNRLFVAFLRGKRLKDVERDGAGL